MNTTPTEGQGIFKTLGKVKLDNEADKNFKMLPDPPEKWSLEQTLSQALMRLDINSRLELEEELHGVRCRAVEESPELNELALAEFDVQLNARKNSDPSITVLRNVMPNNPLTNSPGSSCYLNRPELRLRFLRAELFHVEDAVSKLIHFLEFMSELFGDYVADRPPLISDFNTTEEAALVSSRNTFLPFRDRSGRRVLMGVGNCNFHLDLKTRYKIFMFLLWAVSEDIEAQTRGIVIISWSFDEENDSTWEKDFRPNMSADLRSYSLKQMRSIPVRVVSWQHYYRDTPFFRLLTKLYTFTVDKRYRHIYRAHFGTDMELRYKLAGFGVPIDLMPLSSTGKLKLENHRAWVNVLKAKLKSNPNNPNFREIVECPRINDVVFRKGPATKHNIGNQYYRELIENFSLEHFKGDRTQKYDITMIVIERINKRNGRFLEWKNMWLVYKDMEQVRKKIASAFKQFNREKKKESIELVTAIENAIAIGDDDEKSAVSRSVFTFSQQQGPTKRLKISQDIFDDKGNDDKCFGKCFFSTSNAMHREVPLNFT